MKKTFFSIAALLTIGLFFTECDTPATPPLSPQDASTMTMITVIEANGGLDHALAAGGGAGNGASQAGVIEPIDLSYSAPGISVTGTKIVDGNITTVAVTVVFDNYQNAAKTVTVSGQIDINLVMNSVTHDFSFSYDGDVSILYKEKTYDCSWLCGYGMTGESLSSSGYYSINGYQYTFVYNGPL